MGSARKSKWEKPELTVLVRNKPEEAVLTVCKDGGAVQGPDYEAGLCSPVDECWNYCYMESTS